MTASKTTTREQGGVGTVSPVLLAAVGAVIAVGGALLYRSRYALGPIDDAYIHLQIAKNFARGDGPVFNVGDRVEVTSSPLWTLLLGGLLRVGLPGVSAASLLGLLAGAGAGAMTALLGYEAAGVAGALISPALLGIVPSFGAWTGSAMETPLSLLVLAFATWLSLRARTKVRLLGSAVCSGALVWARPEMLALFPSLLFIAVTRLPKEARARAAVHAGLAWTLPALVLFLSRHAYFHEWFPNTYYAKVADGGLEQRLRGLSYAATFFVQHPLYVALALYAVVRRRPVPLLLGLVATNMLLAIVWAGGDGFSYGRLTLPATPLVCVMAGAVLAELPSVATRSAATALAMLLSVVWSMKGTSEFSRYQIAVAFAEDAAVIAQVLADVPPGTVATEGIGAVAYLTDRPILDLVGLADKHIARSPRIEGAMIGHDHADPAYVLARAPEVVLTLEWMRATPLTDQTEIQALTENYDSWASALTLLRDPRFRERYTPKDIMHGEKHLRVWIRKDLAAKS